MRTFAVLAAFSVFFFGFGAILVAQGPGGQGMGGQGQVRQVQQGGGQPPPWVQGAQPAASGGRGGQPAMQGNQPAVRPQQQQPAAGQANQPNQQARPVAGQPAALNPNQVTQIIARLRAMDTNQNGVLEANEIPANQRDRVNTMITQLGGNPGNAVNLANLERRAMAMAGNAQPSQQRDAAERQPERQQRQQPVEPLVRPFGERVTPEAAPLIFGQRAPAVQATPQAARGAAGQQRNAANQQQGFAPPATVRQSTPYSNIPAALRSNTNLNWFFEFDTDQDGQLSMQEYVAGRGGVWTEQIAGEFAGFGRVVDRNGDEHMDVGLDRNGDGFATLDEVLLTIKERTARLAQEETATAPTRQPGQQGQPGGQQGQVQQVRQASAAPANNVRPQPGGNAVANQGNQGNAPVRMQGNPQMGRGAGNQQPARGGGRAGG